MRIPRILITSIVTSSALICGCLTSCKSSRDASRNDQYPPQHAIGNQFPVTDPGNGFVDISKKAAEVVKEARRWLGTKYTYGGHSRKGTDCSGLVMEVYRSACGMKLPRTTVDQRARCVDINKKNLKPGDLLFFKSNKNGNRISHVGLYIGKGEMIHASSSRGVIVSNIHDKYYINHYHSAGRILQHPDFKHIDRENSVKTPEIIPEITAPANLASAPAPEELLDDILTQTIDSIYTTAQPQTLD